jgi:competence protein ComEA
MPRLRTIALALLLAFPAALLAAQPVNVNTADAATLATAIKGVGEAKAQAIVAYRKQHGPFKSVDDLTEVPGIGDRIVDRNRANLTVTSPANH